MPPEVELEVEMESVEVVVAALMVARLIELGLKLPLAPEGKPLTVRLTEPANPPSGAKDTV